MAIFLVQHGKALPKEASPDPPLSEEGKATVERIAGVAMASCIRPVLIRHSGKVRARETAEIMPFYLKPAGGIEVTRGMDPLDDVITFAAGLSEKDPVMFVGHLPFMESLTAYLVTGSTGKRVVRFQNGGIVCLDRDPGQKDWFIRWTLMPEIG
ncbi:MAG: phosphohistidine phosphatase SixA [Deltaproteobacteria bacterium]|nr:phosphohistidine phosphatase SixA [Deltaproteobacteria bacterium]